MRFWTQPILDVVQSSVVPPFLLCVALWDHILAPANSTLHLPLPVQVVLRSGLSRPGCREGEPRAIFRASLRFRVQDAVEPTRSGEERRGEERRGEEVWALGEAFRARKDDISGPSSTHPSGPAAGGAREVWRAGVGTGGGGGGGPACTHPASPNQGTGTHGHARPLKPTAAERGRWTPSAPATYCITSPSPNNKPPSSSQAARAQNHQLEIINRGLALSLLRVHGGGKRG
ncbi:hypothetical protein MHYP_G00132270 [Metynnis hypsauchen]